jgi:hypothetical protein
MAASGLGGTFGQSGKKRKGGLKYGRISRLKKQAT